MTANCIPYFTVQIFTAVITNFSPQIFCHDLLPRFKVKLTEGDINIFTVSITARLIGCVYVYFSHLWKIGGNKLAKAFSDIFLSLNTIFVFCTLYVTLFHLAKSHFVI